MKRLFITMTIVLASCGGGGDKDIAKRTGADGNQAVKPIPAVEKPAADAPEDAVDVSKAARAAELANAIDREPDKAEALLEEAGLSVEDFEALLVEVASDPMQSEAYAKMRGTKVADAGGEAEDPAG